MRVIIYLFAFASCFMLGAQSIWTTTKNPIDIPRLRNVNSYQINVDRNLIRESIENKKTLSIPYPSGKVNQFQLSESTLMGPELQKKYPEIRTYKGLNEKGESIRIALTPKGLSAIVFTNEGTIYIDPVGIDGQVVSYYRRDYVQANSKPAFIEPARFGKTPITINESNTSKVPKNRTSGSQMKSYRIAIAADHQYVSFHGGTLEGALSAIVTTLNRVTGIYENELAITFVLVDKNDEIIYVNEADDPYNGLQDSGLLDENQTNLDNVIGSNNYDIGHVFKTGSGGLAGLGVVCNTSSKAKGFTGTNTPIGDPFDVDFVAHEIGHQFGGNHTFNGNQGSCEGSTRNAGTAYEPGSGSTIMAYAGICDTDNLQNSSDAYFHSASLLEILTYTEDDSGANCPSVSTTGNTPPEVEAPSGGFTIPIGTAFSLTATGSDSNGDSLTYSWEQLDLGDAAAPNVSSETGPLFKSQPPTTDPTRYFPSLSSIVSGNSVIGEILPSGTRDLTFQVTVRDNNSAGGGTNNDTLSFQTTANAGPFQITSFNASTTIEGGKASLLTWDVANTDKAPVNCSNVSVLLSTDSGVTFDQILLASTPNDGEEFITIPNITNSQARIMIKAVNNIFFDVNGADLAIDETTGPSFSMKAINTPNVTCDDQINLSIQTFSLNNFDENIALSIENLASDITISNFQETISPQDSIELIFTNSSGQAQTNNILIKGNSGEMEETIEVTLTYLATPEEAPLLNTPADEAVGVSLETSIDWSDIQGVENYGLQVATDDQFLNLLTNDSTLTTSELQVGSLNSNTTYFWRVKSINSCGESEFSDTRRFITENTDGNSYMASDLPKDINSQSSTVSVISIQDNFTIKDLNVANLNISHSFIRDLQISLRSPSGLEVIVLDQICAGEDNISMTLDDEGETTIPCPPVDGGNYEPTNALSAFDGTNSLGDWVLTVSDLASGDEGIINGWSLEVIPDEEAIWLFSESSEPTSVTLSWTNISDNNGYELEWESNNEFTNLTTTAVNENSFLVENLDPLSSYSFRVRAVQGNSFSNYSNISPITTLPQLPEAPTGLSAEQLSSSEVLLSWTDNSALEQGFIVERATDQSSFEEVGRVEADIQVFLDQNVETQSTFTYRVSSFNRTGSSDPSNEAVIAVLSTDLDEIKIKVYPNPAGKTLYFEGTEQYKGVRVTDFHGRNLIENQSFQGKNIDISKLKRGIYFLTLSNSEYSTTFKFFKK